MTDTTDIGLEHEPSEATSRVTLVLERFLPGLFPPRSSGLGGTERRVVLSLLLATVVSISLVNAFFGAVIPLTWIEAAWLIAVVGVVIPWHRLPRIAFGSTSLFVAALTALAVRTTGGTDSPYAGFFYLAVILGCVVAPPLWIGLAIGVVVAMINMLPLLYQQSPMLNELVSRTGLLLTAALFGSWLVDELTRVVVVASIDRRRLGEEQEIAAELRRSQSQRQEYMSVVAHELRNPLVAVGAAARVVAKDVQGKPSESIANGIVIEVKHALELLDGLTDVSSLESGRLRIVLRPTELTALVRTVLQGVAPNHDVELRGIESSIDVLADEGRIGQVLRNLVGNAAKYAPAGSTIEVSVGLSPDRRSAVVSVRDEGPGVPPLERPRLFERFARLSTAGNTRGSGLGLYISRGIVRDHHGDLSADWPPGGGSVFTFTLPLVGATASVVPGRSN